jgi:hypothetical protein
VEGAAMRLTPRLKPEVAGKSSTRGAVVEVVDAGDIDKISNWSLVVATPGKPL